MMKLAASRGVGAMIVVVILVGVFSPSVQTVTRQDALHEEPVRSNIIRGPEAARPANELANARDDGGREQPPHPETDGLAEMDHCHMLLAPRTEMEGV
jgi:hypothetical protein